MPDGGPSHLSIGEVLGILLEEFPDVTISKIRFLESQGLIEPERTPSGYRKFFDTDVELLRVILREQREHFLPLRVIKDRIDSGQLDATPPRGAPDPEADAVEETDRPPRRPSNTVLAKHPAASRPGPAAPRRAAASTPRLLPGVLLNRDELCAMAAVTDVQLRQLEEYGVVATRAGHSDLYGDEAVEIASAAGDFLRAGVDARHLRAWRNSVDREAGLFEQLVLPVLRQRNPHARTQATAQLEELDRVGARLRSAMMRAALRRYFET
ncbi:MAG: MerR family transcriptional regulator [Actinomycetota bacterium]|nr:MerR family transcriptional regulator [Actinomycetota bacterium]